MNGEPTTPTSTPPAKREPEPDGRADAGADSVIAAGAPNWFRGRPSACRLWEDPGHVFPRIKPDLDPTTPKAKAARRAAVADGVAPAHR